MLLLLVVLTGCSQEHLTSKPAPIGTTYAHVDRDVDGDTIKVTMHDGTKETIRFLLVDTPETVKPRTPIQPWGNEAHAFTKKELEGKDVQLEIDPKNKRDRYGRLLAYVWINGKDFNLTLVKDGYARVAYVSRKTAPHLQEFNDAQSKARARHLLIWSIDGYVKKDGFHPEVVPK